MLTLRSSGDAKSTLNFPCCCCHESLVVTVDPSLVSLASIGRIDPDRVDGTTEEEIARQKAADEKST